ncbi:MAG: YihY family inner membrane protein [Proteobacteria bacterium]|nr:YihY family inner membrane protein [Pseudomonadota bacterium]
MSRWSTLISEIAQKRRQYYLNGLEDEPRAKRCFYAVFCFVDLFIAEVRNMRLFTRVASGTYTTMLALIPFLIVGASLIITFNKEANIPELVKRINEFVIPIAGDTIANFLTDSLTRAYELGLGPVGLISLIITTVMLFVHIEDTFNDIWHVTKSRALWLRFLLFYAVVTLGPLLISYSIFQATQFIPSEITNNPFSTVITEVLMLSVACFVVFKFLPNTRVHLKNAIIPAAVAGVLIEVAKFGFGLYVNIAFKSTSNYSILYGTLGILPVTLLWLYLTWMMLLFGVEAGYIMQNMHALKLQRCFDQTPGTQNEWVFIGEYAPLEILAALVRNLCASNPPLTAEALAVQCIYPLPAVEAILNRLEKIRVVNRIDGEFAATYLLAKPLDAILLRDVMAAFDESSPRVKKHPKLEAIITQLQAAQAQIWTDSNANTLREDGVTLKDVSAHPTMNLHVVEPEDAEQEAHEADEA